MRVIFAPTPNCTNYCYQTVIGLGDDHLLELHAENTLQRLVSIYSLNSELHTMASFGRSSGSLNG